MISAKLPKHIGAPALTLTLEPALHAATSAEHIALRSHQMHHVSLREQHGTLLAASHTAQRMDSSELPTEGYLARARWTLALCPIAKAAANVRVTAT